VSGYVANRKGNIFKVPNEPSLTADELHSVLVVDPTDTEQMREIVRAINRAYDVGASTSSVGMVVDSLIRQQRGMEEPKKPGSAVVDKDERVWVRTFRGMGLPPWSHDGMFVSWAQLKDPRPYDEEK